MKKLLLFTAYFTLTWILFTTSCKKEKSTNRAPLARTNLDTTLKLPSCNDNSGVVFLDGTGSIDPDNNIVSYRWSYVSGPEGYTLTNPNSAKARLSNLSPGEYVFHLHVSDADGQGSKDKIRITVKATPEEYDMDITINSTFSFINNFSNCNGWYYYYYNCNNYYDLTEIHGSANFPQVGEFTVHLLEHADTSDAGLAHETSIQIYKDNLNTKSVFGTCTVNFKQLIKQGGGAFSGLFAITSGSADACSTLLKDLPPLSVTGNLNLATSTVTLRINGKVYF